MLKKRSRPLNKPTNSTLFPPKAFSEGIDVVSMSPTSILETKSFTPTANPFFSDKNRRKPLVESSPVGLGIVDALKKSSGAESRMVLFGSQLKIQIPSVAPSNLSDCPQSPIEFGINNKNSQLAIFSPARRSSNLVSGSLSATEMEMSEDYTCVIAHGPNPKTTHIFDNCVIESCCGGRVMGKEKGFPDDHRRDCVSGYPSDGFLNYCHACKKSLGLGKDIFMYRGDRAFCSRECRYQEMLLDEGMEDCSPDPSAIL